MEQPNFDSSRDAGGEPAEGEFDRQLEAAANCIWGNDRFLVASHTEPDGDAVASTLGFAELLEQLDKSVVRYNADEIPYNCQFLAGAESVCDEIPDGWVPEVTVLLDCSSFERAGLDSESIPSGATTLVVDHHRTLDESTGDLYLHDEGAAATGELIYKLLESLGAELTVSVAECVYTALMTDTGSFQYSNTSGETFRIAGELVDAGVDVWKMTSCLYENQPLRRIELLGEVLDTLTISSCGRLAFIEIDREVIDDDERIAQLTDGFINYGRSVRGVEVSVQLRELEEGWRVSFRSKGRVDVSAIASRFGGGGHANAAGCIIEDSPQAIREQLTETVVALLDDAD